MRDESFNNELLINNSPDGAPKHTLRGEFLQSEEWRKFQEAVGRKTYNISFPLPKGEGDFGFWANIIEHQLPIVGKYFYVPRGPVISEQKTVNSEQYFRNLINLARENKAGWIRIEPADSYVLDLIRENWRVVKAPHDMQPKEILVMDISKSEEELLTGMKQKTRYNIRLAEKKNINVISNQSSVIEKKYIEEFIRLVRITADRDRITAHPESYYRKMFEFISGEIIKLYVAEYEGKVLAANIMLFYGNTCTYMHGASSDEHREVMAPYLLQWQAIQDAKKAGCEKYDFGGINTRYKIQDTRYNPWAGITRFKIGFGPETLPVEFPGSYDIVINPVKYFIYLGLQKIKGIFI